MRQYSKGEIAKTILISLAIIGMTTVFIALPGTAYIFQLFKPKNHKERGRILQSVKILEKRGMIKRYYKEGKEIIEVTKEGKQKINKYKIDEIKLKKPKKWKGSWVLLAFDIPEKKKGARNALGRKLKEISFYPLQKSLFIYPHDCKEEIDFIVDYFSVQKYVKYLEIKTLGKEDDKRLKKHFKL
jgi:DNA-binding transcriptional regulator PaaX